jgi:CMP-N,N'-diacetyllegionaminic acid synthase
MYQGKKILAVIIARGGSKGIKNKNILPFCGKPLIYWTIKAGKASRYIDRLILSTEDTVILKTAQKFGADVPFRRPKKLSSDHTPGPDVLLHAIDWFKKKDEHFDVIILLQPTSPLREANDIDEAVELLFTKDAESIVAVCPVSFIPERINRLPPDGCMKNFIRRKYQRIVRQNFKESYRINGAVYISYCDHFMKNKRFLGPKTYAYVMPMQRSADIDTLFDWKIAELIMREKIKK